MSSTSGLRILLLSCMFTTGQVEQLYLGTNPTGVMGMSYLLASPLAPLEVSSFLPLASSDGQPAFGVLWAFLEFCVDGIIWHVVYCVSAFTSSHSRFLSVLLFQCLGQELVFL